MRIIENKSLSISLTIAVYVFLSFLIPYVLITFTEIGGFILYASPILGPISFLTPIVMSGFKSFYISFIFFYAVFSCVLGFLIVPRFYKETTKTIILFWVGIFSWFVTGILAFLGYSLG